MELFIPDVFEKIAPFFDEARWKAFRTTCRAANELFRYFCCMIVMVLRTGDPLRWRPVLKYLDFSYAPCAPHNRALILRALRKQLPDFSPPAQVGLLARHRINFSLEEMRYVMGKVGTLNELVMALRGPRVTLGTWLFCAAMGNDFLVYLARRKVKGAFKELVYRCYRGDLSIFRRWLPKLECKRKRCARQREYLVWLRNNGILIDGFLCMNCHLYLLERRYDKEYMLGALACLLMRRRIDCYLLEWTRLATRYRDHGPVEIRHVFLRRRKARKMVQDIHEITPDLIRCEDHGESCSRRLRPRRAPAPTPTRG